MKIENPFKSLTRFELCLWLISFLTVGTSYFLQPEKNILTLFASLIGVTALIFIAKGRVIGEVLVVIFAIIYGIISIQFKYYGEAITYLCMSAPMAIVAIVSWVRHPFKDTKEVEISRVNKKQTLLMTFLSIIVTILFYFILKYLGTASLIFSTLSVTTSFVAVYLTALRSPFYALGYVANDIVLIVLWIIATIENSAYFPMIICFVMFLLNDIYGFINWSRMALKQKGENNGYKASSN